MATPPPRNNPISGVGYFFKGLSLITQKGVKRYVVIPLLINILLFSVAITVSLIQLPVLISWTAGLLPVWLGWLSWLLLPLVVVVVALVAFFGFAVMGNLIAAPFNGPLAEAVEKKLTGEPLNSLREGQSLIKDVSVSILSELRKLGYFAIRAIPLLILLLIPVINLVASVLWLLFASWMLALEYADYPMANHGLSFHRQRDVLRQKRFLSLGYGGVLTLVLVIPGLNFLLIPAGVAGATAMWVDQLSAAAKPTGS